MIILFIYFGKVVKKTGFNNEKNKIGIIFHDLYGVI